MDHILEHEGQPVPDLSSVSASTVGASRGGGPGEDVDDEDVEALKAVYGHTGGLDAQAAAASAAADVEAKASKP